MSGWKDWQIGEVVEAAEFQTFLQDQVVQVYADSSARGSALGTAVAEGMASYVKDTDSFEVYDGTGWVPVSVDAAWVTAGTAGEILRSNGTADPSWVEAETTLTSGTSGFTALSAGTAGISYQPVSHNYIINGAFDEPLWQRGTSFTNPATAAYTADRWQQFFNDANPTSWTISRQTLGASDIEAIGHGAARFAYRVGITTIGSNTVFQFNQPVEDVRTLANQVVTVSYYAKASTATSVRLDLVQDFGSGGSGAVTHAGTAQTVGTSWARYTQTTTLGSMSGKTIGPGSMLRTIFRVINATSGLNLDIWGVQLEAGSVATPFKRHAPSLQGELAACQRYYYRANASAAFATLSPIGMAVNTTLVGISYTLPVPMRVYPTSLERATDLWLSDNSSNFDPTQITLSGNGGNNAAANIDVLVASGLTQFRPMFLRAKNNATAFIAFSAEL